MNFRAIGKRVRASVLAVAAGWATATLLTLPMQFYEIVTNNLYGRRTLLWSLAAGTLIWIGWTLLITAGPALDGLTLGEDTARSLGFDLNRLRLQLIAGTALAVWRAIPDTRGDCVLGGDPHRRVSP